jgi:hypothetical protein
MEVADGQFSLRQPGNFDLFLCDDGVENVHVTTWSLPPPRLQPRNQAAAKAVTPAG